MFQDDDSSLRFDLETCYYQWSPHQTHSTGSWSSWASGARRSVRDRISAGTCRDSVSDATQPCT